MLHYGYFVLLPDGRLVAAGNDWGRTPDTYKAGDSMGVKNGSEGVVVGVLKGDPAKRFGVDVMVIVDQQFVEERKPLSSEFVSAVMQQLKLPPSPATSTCAQILQPITGLSRRSSRQPRFSWLTLVPLMGHSGRPSGKFTRSPGFRFNRTGSGWIWTINS